jgi:hypothetical protein
VRLRTLFAFFIGLLTLLLGGCSAMRLAYNNADTFLRWEANRWFDLEGEQRVALDGHLATLLGWHRSQVLPRYVTLAEDAVKRVERGLLVEDMKWISDTVRAQAAEALVTAAREAAPLLDRLTPEQIVHLEKRLAHENRKFADEHLRGTAAERRERRLKRMIERMEDWIGRLEDPQILVVRRHNENTPLADEMRDAHRKRLQAEFLAITRGREARFRLADWAARVVAGPTQDGDPAYAEYLRQTEGRYFAALLEIERMATAAQRREVVKRVRGYAEDFRFLAAAAVPKGAGAGAR